MRYTPRSMIPITLAGLAVLTLVTACTQTASYSNNAAPQSYSMDMAGDAEPALYAVRAFDLGQIVVDGQGMTLYRYEKDSANPPRSACDSACLKQWEPVPAAAGKKVMGID